MIYELWEIINDGTNEVPFILLNTNSSFNIIYKELLNNINKNIPCAIFIKLENI